MSFVNVENSGLQILRDLLFIVVRLNVSHFLDFFFLGASLDLVFIKSFFKFLNLLFLEFSLRSFSLLLVNMLNGIFLSESVALN